MHGTEDEARDDRSDLSLLRFANCQDYARSHTLRLATLALLASRQFPDPTVIDLRAALPDAPSPVVIRYHLRVLQNVGLIVERLRGDRSVYGLS